MTDDAAAATKSSSASPTAELRAISDTLLRVLGAAQRSNAAKFPGEIPYFEGTYDEKITVSEFINRFQLVARALEWDDRMRALYLPLYLRGKAADFYEILPNETQKNFTKLLTTLREHFTNDQRAQCAALRLQHIRKERDESIEQFASRIRQMGKIAFPYLDAPVRSRQLTTHFILGLPKPERDIVWNRDPKNLDVAEEMAIRTSYRLDLSASLESMRFGQNMDGPRDSRQYQNDFALREQFDNDFSSDLYTQLPWRQHGTPGTDEKRQCDYLWEPRGTNFTREGLPQCFECGKHGHVEQNCTRRQSEMREQRYDINLVQTQKDWEAPVETVSSFTTPAMRQRQQRKSNARLCQFSENSEDFYNDEFPVNRTCGTQEQSTGIPADSNNGETELPDNLSQQLLVAGVQPSKAASLISDQNTEEEPKIAAIFDNPDSWQQFSPATPEGLTPEDSPTPIRFLSPPHSPFSSVSNDDEKAEDWADTEEWTEIENETETDTARATEEEDRENSVLDYFSSALYSRERQNSSEPEKLSVLTSSENSGQESEKDQGLEMEKEPPIQETGRARENDDRENFALDCSSAAGYSQEPQDPLEPKKSLLLSLVVDSGQAGEKEQWEKIGYERAAGEENQESSVLEPIPGAICSQEQREPPDPNKAPPLIKNADTDQTGARKSREGSDSKNGEFQAVSPKRLRRTTLTGSFFYSPMAILMLFVLSASQDTRSAAESRYPLPMLNSESLSQNLLKLEPSPKYRLFQLTPICRLLQNTAQRQLKIQFRSICHVPSN